ncbi:carbohydrate porin [Novipirellula aureliae]|uniref:carbohydrate porin n=1 Tax=Novipirellula aureliae TaxID=2527966 RepID=UPI0018CD8601|nr:carbohydrate porin [Novipirellula aureliae]
MNVSIIRITVVLLLSAVSCLTLSHPLQAQCDDACDRYDQDGQHAKSSLEEYGITFEGSIGQLYQGVSSGGLERKFRYGGHGDYDIGIDFGKLCDVEGFTIELGAEHRFAQTVNPATGSIVPVALLPNLPDADKYDLALTQVLFNYEVSDQLELFFGKLDTLEFDTNRFADGNGSEKFFSSALNYNPAMTRTIPFSTLGAGFNLMRDGERAFTLMVLNTEDTGTTVGISELFAQGAVIVSELALPTNLFGLPGHQRFGGSWSSATYDNLEQDGRITIPDVPIAAKQGSWSLFWNADQFLWQDPCDSSRGWGMFGRAGISDGNPNPIAWFASAGVGGHSQLPGRGDDTFGLGWYYTGISDEFGPVIANLLSDGQGVELYYDVAMNESFHVAFDLQVVEPNAATLGTAIVPGVRARIDF